MYRAAAPGPPGQTRRRVGAACAVVDDRDAQGAVVVPILIVMLRALACLTAFASASATAK